MKTEDQLARHTSQISRLEQVMTALAEAQVKTEDETAEMRRAIAKLANTQDFLAKSHDDLAKAQARTEAALTALAEAQAQTTREFQAYLRTRKN